jgi:hydroxymethylpyrimidine pyrophosphatase-like HAD family hydrolase
MADVAALAAEVSDRFTVTPAVLALNIHPAGIDKGTGLAWLAQVIGIDPVDMAGVGDSSGDIDFLRLVGDAAAPANATDNVKSVAHYLSTLPDAAGLHDILDFWLA